MQTPLEPSQREDARGLVDADRDRRAGAKPPQDADELCARKRHAAVRRVAGVDVEEHRRAAPGNGGGVELEDREQAIRDGCPPERFASAAKRPPSAARDISDL